MPQHLTSLSQIRPLKGQARVPFDISEKHENGTRNINRKNQGGKKDAGIELGLGMNSAKNLERSIMSASKQRENTEKILLARRKFRSVIGNRNLKI